MPRRSAKTLVSFPALDVIRCSFQGPGLFCGFSYQKHSLPGQLTMIESTQPSPLTSSAKFWKHWL